MQTTVELEACIAACLLLEGGKTINAVEIELGDIVTDVCKATISAARELERIDAVIVNSWAKGKFKVTSSELSAIINAVPTSKNLVFYVAELNKCIYSKKLLALRLELMQLAKTAENLTDLAERLSVEECRLRDKYLDCAVDYDLMADANELLENIASGTDSGDLVPTGVEFIDELHGGGLMPNEVLVIAARPGVGKTALTLQIATDCNFPVALFSLEMSKKQIVPRILAATALKNVRQAVRKPSLLTPSDVSDFLAVAPTFADACSRVMVFDKPDQTIDDIRRYGRRAVSKGAKLILIDYLQLIRTNANKNSTRENQVAELSRSIKMMGKELNVPVVLLCQISREVEKADRTPILSDLRESGAIEQDASSVLFLHDMSKTDNERNASTVTTAGILAKGRDVGKGFIASRFDKNHQRFYSLGGIK